MGAVVLKYDLNSTSVFIGISLVLTSDSSQVRSNRKKNRMFGKNGAGPWGAFTSLGIRYAGYLGSGAGRTIAVAS